MPIIPSTLLTESLLMSRPSFDDYGITLARAASLRATCLRAEVGAVIVDFGGVVLATGYNGSQPGLPHCQAEGCLMVRGHCARCIHAEMNALHRLPRDLDLSRATLYATHHPCHTCAHLIALAGIPRVLYLQEYGVTDNERALIRQATGLSIDKAPRSASRWQLPVSSDMG